MARQRANVLIRIAIQHVAGDEMMSGSNHELIRIKRDGIVGLACFAGGCRGVELCAVGSRFMRGLPVPPNVLVSVFGVV